MVPASGVGGSPSPDCGLVERSGSSGALKDQEPSGSSPRCRACGATNVRDLGPLPRPVSTFGGQRCPVPIAPGRLWRCLECDLSFRFPCLNQVELTALYEDLPDW